jgi:hypothetical protein
VRPSTSLTNVPFAELSQQFSAAIHEASEIGVFMQLSVPFEGLHRATAPFGVLLLALSLTACTSEILDPSAQSGSGGAAPNGGANADPSGLGGATANAGRSNESGGTTSNPGGGSSATSGGAAPSGSGGATALDCSAPSPGRSPLRRLTTHEYNNTVRDLLGDTTNPGSLLPAQIDSKDNWFGNDADFQSVPDTLVEKYQSIAEQIAARATADTAALGRLHACAGKTLAASEEESCARSIASALAPRAYRRATTSTEIDDLVALYRSVRAISPTLTFASGVAAMLEGLLESPEFLYRVEFGSALAGSSKAKRVTGREMATRLSYLLWQTMPDASLVQAADAGRLDTKEGILAQAASMLDDKRSHATVAFFFDNFLPIPDLGGLARDKASFPTWSGNIGAAMRNEVQRVLEHEIFENTEATASYAPGSWPAILSSNYTFVDQALYDFYGPGTFAANTSVTGSEFKKVRLNPDQRLGLLTLGGIMAGGTTSNRTNPVLRGIFVVNRVMCLNLELPTGFTPPQIDPYSGKTARERVAKHSQDQFCAGCHKVIDPLGLPFENYDAVGLYRASEKWTDPNSNVTYDTPIDASGSVPGVSGTAANAVELARQLASSERVQECFATHWMHFGYGRSLEQADACTQQSLLTAFKQSGYNVKQLLLALTQTDAFLYRAVD